MSASTGTTTPATVPASQVVPFPLPWGGVPCPPIPGCAPGCGPAGMDALMKCYMDIKNAMAFISKVMIDLINNDPAVAQAIIAAIEKSGSNLPLIGVTNGAGAAPGQVGELFFVQQVVAYPTSAQNTTVTMGILQPGDWDYWAFGVTSTFINDILIDIPTLPAGFDDTLWTTTSTPEGADTATVVSTTGCALTSVPSLVALQVQTNIWGDGSAAGNLTLSFRARRRR